MMDPLSRILPGLLVLAQLAAPVRAGEVAPEALAAARGSHRRCVEQLEAMQAERNPFCVALVRRDPSMCSRVPPAGQPACRFLADVRRWMGILLRPCHMIPQVGDPLDRRCPATLPPGIVVDDAPCRRLLLSHMILPGRAGRADVLVKMVNPFDEVARCHLRLSAIHQDHDPEERSLQVVLLPRSPLDRRIPIRYDAGTQSEVEVTCGWGP
ncbi:MAG: hypothetical protein ABIK09_06670 [Pseudomonadota bacterium]